MKVIVKRRKLLLLKKVRILKNDPRHSGFRKVLGLDNLFFWSNVLKNMVNYFKKTKNKSLKKFFNVYVRINYIRIEWFKIINMKHSFLIWWQGK